LTCLGWARRITLNERLEINAKKITGCQTKRKKEKKNFPKCSEMNIEHFPKMLKALWLHKKGIKRSICDHGIKHVLEKKNCIPLMARVNFSIMRTCTRLFLKKY